jgi:DNA-binding GntR family transcriptional regulator
MTSDGEPGSGEPASRAAAAGVLADRIAAALVHHEPGWRLPRLTALARRYSVSVAEIDAAVDELAARHVLRRLPDGQVYRASPAGHLVPLEGLAGLCSLADPMGGELTCRSRQAPCHSMPEGTTRVLRLAPGEAVLVIRSLWLVGGEPGAMSATCLPARLAGMAGHFASSPRPAPGPAVAAPAEPPQAGEGTGDGWPAGIWDDISGDPGPGTLAPAVTVPAEAVGLPRAIQLELGPPPPPVARGLRLSAGQAVATVTVRFDDPLTGAPVALSTVMLRPDLFRIVLQG